MDSDLLDRFGWSLLSPVARSWQLKPANMNYEDFTYVMSISKVRFIRHYRILPISYWNPRLVVERTLGAVLCGRLRTLTVTSWRRAMRVRIQISARRGTRRGRRAVGTTDHTEGRSSIADGRPPDHSPDRPVRVSRYFASSHRRP